MKKTILIVLALVFFLSACGEYEQHTPEPVTTTKYLLTESSTQFARTGDFISTRYYYTSDGRLECSIVEQNGVESYRLTYTYDESGKKATGSGLTYDGSIIIGEIVYDSAGNLLRSATYNMVDKKRIPLTSTDNSYDNTGNLTQEEHKSYLSGDIVSHTLTVYAYDENGHPITVTTSNKLDGSYNSSHLYCDGKGNIILPFSTDGSITYCSYDDHGNLVATESYLRGEFIQCTINQYTAIESVQISQPQQSITIDTTADDTAINDLLTKVFYQLQAGETAILADALPDELISLAKTSQTDLISFFSGDRVFEKCYHAGNSVQISIRQISYHPSASHFIISLQHAPEDTKTIYTSIFENSTTAAVSIDIEEEFGTSIYIAFLYRYEGCWYYLTSIPMYIAG